MKILLANIKMIFAKVSNLLSILVAQKKVENQHHDVSPKIEILCAENFYINFSVTLIDLATS